MHVHTKVFKRPDGSKVRLTFKLGRWSEDFLFSLRVEQQEPRKRSWGGIYDTNDYFWRKMTTTEQEEAKKQALFKLVTEEELLEATKEAHAQLMPTKENLFSRILTVS
jgi:hypothetical protein